MSDERLGRVAVVTGAAGGLGRAFARRLASEGCRLALTDRISCAGVIPGDTGSGAVFEHLCDLNSPDEIKAFGRAVLDHFGQVDILINNAAQMGMQPLEDLDVETFRSYLRVNVEAPLLMSKAFIPGMKARGYGRILNIVSNAAWAPFPGVLGYVTSKMALVGLTRALAVELGDSGITVNALAPNLTRHRNTEPLMPPEAFDEQAQRQAIKRPATPQDVVGAAMFLTSDDAAFMTGQTLSVDGGQILL